MSQTGDNLLNRDNQQPTWLTLNKGRLSGSTLAKVLVNVLSLHVCLRYELCPLETVLAARALRREELLG